MTQDSETAMAAPVEPTQPSTPSQPAPEVSEVPASTAPPSDVENVKRLAAARLRIEAEIAKRIVGQRDVVELLLVSVFARGHGLFVGVPGLAKTLLVQTLAEVLSLKSARIQFTPDLMPADITGTDILEEDPSTGKRSFRFVKGPVFTQLLLADEINRTPPKTQAALLQAMAEGRVTAGGTTHALDQPYLVFATQNPIEQEGTYPLPEAQLDRFLMQIDVAYPSAREEFDIVRSTTDGSSAQPEAVLGEAEVLAFQELVPRIPVAEHVLKHAISLVRRSRPEDEEASPKAKEYLSFGAGPRAGQALILGAKALAALEGRFAAETDDVDRLAKAVLRHRLVLNFKAEAEGIRREDIVEALLRGE